MRVSLALLAASALLVVYAAPKSRFTKDIDEQKLEKEWADEEDEEWHEDTFEWKRKLAQKKATPLDLNELSKAAKGNKMQEKVLQHEAQSGNMQMAFATVKKSVTTDEKEVEKIGQRWTALLATNGVQTKLYPIGGQDLLMTEEDGRILEIKDFLMQQPELEKFRWKDTDFTPTPTPKPTKAARAAKKAKTSAKTEL